MALFTVWVVVCTNRWGSPTVRVLETEKEAIQWGHANLINAFQILGLDKSLYEGREFKQGEFLDEAPEFSFTVKKDFFIYTGDDLRYVKKDDQP